MLQTNLPIHKVDFDVSSVDSLELELRAVKVKELVKVNIGS